MDIWHSIQETPVYMVRELYHFRIVTNKLFLPSFQSKKLKFVL